jgi:hypothetical protein
MIENFQGMEFGQFDHLAESIFFEQQSQPGASSSAHQFPHGPPPHFAPQYRPGPQVFASGPQMFAAQQFPQSGPLTAG